MRHDDPARFPRLALFWGRVGRDLTVAASVALAAYAVIVTQGTVDDIASESADRRDQSCLIFERQEAEDIDALERTYSYLSGLSAAQLDEPLNRAVLAQLPRTVRDAQTPDAPAYCDEPDVGLPEPVRPPRFPRRPPNLPPA